MTTQLREASEYRADVDPLHRNVWPVRIGDDPTVIGYLHEHVTVTLDLPQPPERRWSWVFEDAEGDRLRVDEGLRASRARYTTWRRALDAFTHVHQLTVELRDEETRQAAERARKGEQSHDYEPGDTAHPMSTDPNCRVCGETRGACERRG